MNVKDEQRLREARRGGERAKEGREEGRDSKGNNKKKVDKGEKEMKE